MKKSLSRAISAVLATCMTLSVLPSAAVAAEKVYSYKSIETVSDGLSFTADYAKGSSGWGTQTYIYEYTPGGNTVPIVAYGDELYGKSDVNRVTEYCEQNGMTVMAAFNGDFFSMSSGVPTGIVVREGRLCSSDGSWNAVGFKSDGTAICGAPKLDMTFAVNGGQRYPIAAFNKVRDTSGIFLYSSDYSSSTHLSAKGVTVVLKKVSSDDYLKIGGSLVLEVVSAGYAEGATALDDDTLVLTYQLAASVGVDLTALKPGDSITIYTGVRGGGDWQDVEYACGAGDMMIENSALTSDATSSSKGPRTMLGIKNDGSIAVLVCDGRNKGESDGLTFKEAAMTLYNMGCKNVVNLDGGGSSIATVRYPGYEDSEVISDPSDGTPRKCANFIMFVNTGDESEHETQAAVYPRDALVLAGGGIELSALSYNSSYYPKGSYDDCFTVSSGDGYIDGSTLTVTGGSSKVTVSADIRGLSSSDAVVTVIDEPETLQVYKKGASSPITAVSLDPGETIDLDVVVTDGLREIASDDSQFTFKVSGGIGEVDSSGVFTAYEVQGISGSVEVSFGSKSYTVPITVGKAPEVISGFESSTDVSASAPEGGFAAAGVNLTADNARYGMGSLVMSADGTQSGGSFIYELANSLKISSGMKQISFMAKGSGSWNMVFSTSSGKVMVPVNLSDGWSLNICDVPSGATAISGFTTEVPMGEKSGLYVDQVIGHYGACMADTTPPQIEFISMDGTLELAITDDGAYPLEKANLSVKLDGKSYSSYVFEETSGRLSVTLPQDGKLHVVTIEVSDYFGNLSRYSAEQAGESTSPFADISGHWGERYISFLYGKGVFTADKNFNPGGSATNEMVATMISRYMGIDTSLYENVQLPYADMDKVHDWALPHVKALYSLGIMQGGSDNQGNIWFYPTDAANRGRVMTVLGRTISRGYDYPMASYSDIMSAPEWSRDHISLLTYLGIVNGYGSENAVKAEAGITRAEIAALLYRLY